MSKPTGHLEAAGQRLDKWLWAARFFRTRALAAAAVRGGKVRHNGVRLKPSRLVKAGDRLEVSRGEERFELTVSALSSRRLPAVLAAKLYLEEAASKQRREAQQDLKRIDRAARPDFGKRPDKRSRRLIRRLSGKGEDL